MDRQARLKPTRKPIGLTFCPIIVSCLVRRGHFFGMFTRRQRFAGLVGLLGLEFARRGFRGFERRSGRALVFAFGGSFRRALGLVLLGRLRLARLFQDRFGLD